MKYTESFGCKNEKQNIGIFLVIAQNIDCGNTLILTSTHNLCFGAKIRKIGIHLQTPFSLFKRRYFCGGSLCFMSWCLIFL